MSSSESAPSAETIHFKDVFGIFVLSPNEVEFRTGNTSGKSFLVSDPEQRGLLGSIIEKIVSPQPMRARPWNKAESELLGQLMPELHRNGLLALDDERQIIDGDHVFSIPLLNKPITEARIAIVGDGILGDAVQRFLLNMPCGFVTVVESSSVATSNRVRRPQRAVSRPKGDAEWIAAIHGHDWIIAAQDAFEPEELLVLNKAALRHRMPWSLVCFDGYEGWVGPTFVPGQTACFSCFRRRLYAGAAEPKHVFADPAVKVHRVPSPCFAGPEANAWVSLIASMFALEIVAVMNGRGFTINHILTVHRLNLTFQRESVLRLPRCAECSPYRDAPRPNVFAHVLATRGQRPTN